MENNYTVLMSNIFDQYAGETADHGRAYMKDLLNNIEYGDDREGNTEKLIEELYIFSKIHKCKEIESELFCKRFDRDYISGLLEREDYAQLEEAISQGQYENERGYLMVLFNRIKKAKKDKNKYKDAEQEEAAKLLLEELCDINYRKIRSIIMCVTDDIRRDGLIRLLTDIKHEPQSEDMKILLINKIFESLRNDEDIRQMVREGRYNEIRAIIDSGDEIIDKAKQIFRGIYDEYDQYPSSQSYIKRVVMELRKDKTHDESVRLAIVRQFLSQGITYEGDQEIDINNLSESIFDSMTGLTLSKDDRMECLVSAVYDNLIKKFDTIKNQDQFNGDGEKKLYIEWKNQLAKSSSSSVKTKKACMQKAMQELEGRSEEFDFSYITNPTELFDRFEAVRRKTDLSSAEDKFIYGKWTEHMKDKRKQKKDGYKLLTLASDLAEGIIKQNNKTRVQLLDFAVAFDMQCNVDVPDTEELGVIDINNSLLGDYYVNSVIRLALDSNVDDPDTVQDNKQIDYDSVAATVNYKNPIECIYVYYLNQTELSAAEKWKRINRLKKKFETDQKKQRSTDKDTQKQSHVNYADSTDTVIYRENFIDALDLSEKDFEEYILSFNIFEYDSAFNYNTAMISSRVFYESVYSEMMENIDNIGQKMNRLQTLGLGINDDELYRLTDYDRGFYHSVDRSFVGAFRDLLLERPYGLEYITVDYNDKTDTFREKNISRYNMLNLLYYKFVMEGQGMYEYDYSRLFGLFDVYTQEYMEETRYQRINKKNIFDVLLVYAIYINSYLMSK